MMGWFVDQTGTDPRGCMQYVWCWVQPACHMQHVPALLQCFCCMWCTSWVQNCMQHKGLVCGVSCMRHPAGLALELIWTGLCWSYHARPVQQGAACSPWPRPAPCAACSSQCNPCTTSRVSPRASVYFIQQQGRGWIGYSCSSGLAWDVHCMQHPARPALHAGSGIDWSGTWSQQEEPIQCRQCMTWSDPVCLVCSRHGAGYSPLCQLQHVESRLAHAPCGMWGWSRPTNQIIWLQRLDPVCRRYVWHPSIGYPVLLWQQHHLNTTKNM